MTTPAARWKLFLALSRTPHGLLDMAAPAFAALLCLGAFPPLGTVILGCVAVFSGYTAVYALNDVIGYRSDMEKLAAGGFTTATHHRDLDALMVRHPMAQGLLSFPEGLGWALAWAALAVISALALNPVCVWIFLIGALLEIVYCLLWRVSPYRAVVNGIVKTLGSLAAVFAVDPHPSPLFLLWLFLAFFCWEIGGQNIPNDWADITEDRRFGAKTIPVYFGERPAEALILVALIFAVGFGVLLLRSSPLDGRPLWILGYLIGSLWLLLAPAWRMHRHPRPATAMALFNRASYYPLFLLLLVLSGLAI